MAERTFNQNFTACVQWEMLLADALDGLLRPEDEALFSAHRAVCPACAALFEEARRGREWLEFLSPEPEVPAGLMDKILARTGPGQMEGFGLTPAGINVVQMPAVPAWQHPGFMGQLRRFAEPRLLMTAAMAFFSIALTLNLTGIRLSSVRMASLRPATLRTLPGVARSFVERQLTMASTPVIRYYDHSRLVYEVETRVRELRRAMESQEYSRTRPTDAAPGESRVTPGSGHGYRRQDSLALTSLTAQFNAHPRPAQSGGSATSIVKRSTQWTA